MTARLKLVLVDDHAMVQEALGQQLKREADMEVVGTANNAEEAIDVVLEAQPDVVLMDIDMPGLVSFDAVRRIGTLAPKVKVVFLSAFTHDQYIQQALRVKARGYVAKSEPLEKVVDAVRTVAKGGTFFSKRVRERMTVDTDGVGLAGGEKATRSASLSDRELEVLRYVASGLSKKEIASTMHLSVKTVENHCTNLMTKLDIHDRVELARFAIREGVVQP